PSRSITSPTARRTWSASVTSALTAIAVTPSRSRSLTTAADPSMSRTNSTTSLPASARAVTSARPMPRLAPVTTETFPDSENASSTDMGGSCSLGLPGGARRGRVENVSFEGCAVGQSELTVRYQNCRSRQVSLILGQLDFNGAAGHVDAISHRQRGLILIKCPGHRGSGDSSGTAGAGLPDAPFEHAHADVLRTNVAYELQIDPLGKLLSWVPAWSAMAG